MSVVDYQSLQKKGCLCITVSFFSLFFSNYRLCQNPQLQDVSKNYIEQIRVLTARHREFYRNLIKSLYERDELPAGAELALARNTAPVQRYLFVIIFSPLKWKSRVQRLWKNLGVLEFFVYAF